MATIVTRAGKGSPLTHDEVDANFENLDSDKLEISGGSMSGNLFFGDGDKAIFGDGSDLQIYHTGTSSYIRDVGDGDLQIVATDDVYIRGYATNNYMARFAETGAVTLYHNNSAKLATTSTGVDVTGTITAAGSIIATGAAASYTDTGLYLQNKGSSVFDVGAWRSGASVAELTFSTDSGSDAAPVEAMRIDSAGRVGIGTSNPSTDLDVAGGIRSTSSGGYNQITTTSIGDAVFNNNGNNWLTVKDGVPANAMRIDSAGRVGIGTSDPDALFTVKGQTVIGSLVAESANLTNLTSGTPPQLIAGWSVPAITWTPNASTEAVFTREGSTNIDILAGASSFSSINFSDTDDEDVGAIQYDHSTNAMRFRVNASERMRIDSSGNVGIGKTNPATPLDVNGTVTATAFAGDGSNLTGIAAGATGGGNDDIFYENGQNVTTNYTITNGKNAMSAGPITIDSGVTVTVGAGETWTVI
jgi:hypothetical protein